jgi:hypothetical protein
MEEQFPNKTAFNNQPESCQTPRYNCLAWAVHNDLLNIWPDQDNSWPVVLPRQETVESIVAFLVLLGFQDCVDDQFDPAVEKVAIYARHGVPQHVARQKRDGRWTSKLGPLADVWHSSPNVFSCPGQVDYSYGIVVRLMARPWTGEPPVLPPMHPPPPIIIVP